MPMKYLFISGPIYEKGKQLDKPQHIKTQHFLHHHLPTTYCSKDSFLFLEWTGKLTAVAT
ncbi:hypothetical protein [Priestia sp. YIM B13551]|uniref:hypothetical protein n=1 Tax=Priestia sp. YIM B13551 TaxID=3366306 RepID=UPI003672B3C9